jgi:hypothetical protein
MDVVISSSIRSDNFSASCCASIEVIRLKVASVDGQEGLVANYKDLSADAILPWKPLTKTTDTQSLPIRLFGDQKLCCHSGEIK